MSSDPIKWVDDIRAASLVTARQRANKPDHIVRLLTDHAYENGLSAEVLDQVVDVLASKNHLDQSCTVALVKSLYPESSVPDDAVFKVIGCLGQGVNKPNANTQNGLLKWLIMVYDVLEHPRLLSRLYRVLFNLLDMISLRATLCHLLSLITRRKHVRPYRIQMLLELARIVGEEPALVGLIRVFKDYYPDIIIQNTAKARASLFQHPSKAWKERLSEIQQKHASKDQPGTEVYSSFKVARRGVNVANRGRNSALPDLRTSHANESTVTLEEVETVDDFIDKLDRIELPNQIVSILGDPLLQKYLDLKPSNVALKRLDNWLSTFMAEELNSLVDNEVPNGRMSEVLSCLAKYAQVTRSPLPPSCYRFLKSLLPNWQGSVYRDEVLQLSALLPLEPFEGAFQTYFIHIETALLDNTLASKLGILQLYTNLLRHWTTLSLNKKPSTRHGNDDPLSNLVTYVDVLCLTILDSPSDPRSSAVSHVLTFWETATVGLSHSRPYSPLRITIPSAPLVYALLFTPSLSTLSRLCSILVLYKQAFEAAMATSTPGAQRIDYPRPYVNQFNGYLMDICNCLWRNRAFNADDVNALGCLAPREILSALRQHADQVTCPLPTMFSLSHSSVLCAVSIASFRALEDERAEEIEVRHAGPVTQRSLAALGSEGGIQLSWAAYRLEVLGWLEGRGVGGVSSLMYNTMKHLLSNSKGRESVGERSQIV
ncbi:MAG: hypothetical protein M1814_002756 [Vezdaea aestivalis]|nr:MAG: hypothetical protein M1814_002756 [Vezdaea aestivalis]